MKNARNPVTPKAIALFQQMQQVASHSDEWRALHSALSRELRLAPWEYPAIAPPDALPSHPPGTAGGIWFPEAQRLWRELDQ
jgi:hypothetical protein